MDTTVVSRPDSSLRVTREQTLRRYWYPVARTDGVRDSPVARTLLGVGLVLWRAGEPGPGGGGPVPAPRRPAVAGLDGRLHAGLPVPRLAVRR